MITVDSNLKRFKANKYTNKLYTITTGDKIRRGHPDDVMNPLTKPSKNQDIIQFYSSMKDNV